MGFSEGAAAMVTVLAVTVEKSYALITLDTHESFRIRKNDLARFHFAAGQQFDEQEFSDLMLKIQYPHALDHAVRMLAMRPCSKGEILRKLKGKKYTDAAISMVLYKLDRENLTDDEQFTEQWIGYRSSQRYGKERIIRELRYKGIPDEMIHRVLDRLNLSDEDEKALELARKCWNRMKPDEDIRKKRQKVISSLVRRGYSWEIAEKACRTVGDEA